MSYERNKTGQGEGIFTQSTGLGQAPSGYGLYDSLFANNPYRNLQYNKSIWQELLGNLGFRTDADRFQEEAQANAAEWDANVYAKMYDEQYNSETSKAQRMRDAGENPDLLGTQGVSEASGMPMDPQGMTAGMPDNFTEFASGIMGCFNTGIGIAGQLMQFSQMKSGIEGQNIENAENMMKIIDQRVLGMTPNKEFETDKEFQAWKEGVEGSLRFQYGNAFFKGTSRRRWNRSIDNYVGNLPQTKEQFKQWKERLENAKEYRYGLEDHWNEARDVFKLINDELIAIRRENTENKAIEEKTGLEAKIAHNENEEQYELALNPGERAEAENSKWRRQTNQEDFEGVLTKHLNNLGKKLDELSKEGGLKGILAEIILFFLNTRMGLGINDNGMNISGGLALPPLN